MPIRYEIAPMDKNMRIGVNVRAEMSRAGVRQSALADELGIPQSAVSKRLRGRTPFSAVELLQIADLLGVSVSVLYAHTPTEGAAS